MSFAMLNRAKYSLVASACAALCVSPVHATPTETECFLNWAETVVPTLLTPHTTTQNFGSFLAYRFYPSTSIYFAVMSDVNVVATGGIFGNTVAQLGSLNTYLPTAKAANCGLVETQKPPAPTPAPTPTPTPTPAPQQLDSSSDVLGDDAVLVQKTYTTTPDTGITSLQCYGSNANLVACTSPNAIYKQDGKLGRDASSSTNTPADGKLGFSYSEVTNANGINYSRAQCIKDNVTGLTWEGKASSQTTPPTTHIYSSTNEIFNPSNPPTPHNRIDYKFDLNNAIIYKNYVNSISLCGYNNWRLPTAHELQTLVDYGKSNGVTNVVMIDADWLVNPGFTNNNRYWSSETLATNTNSAWFVDFVIGDTRYTERTTPYQVRLVRNN